MHAEIIKRLEGLTGPEREVDADIYIALHIPAERVGKIDRLGGCVGWWPKDGPSESAIDVTCYTASLDAAVALVERVLPGAEIGLCDIHSDFRQPGEARHIAEVMHDLTWVTYDGFPEPNYQTTGSGKANSRAIALLIALFRALDARARQESEG